MTSSSLLDSHDRFLSALAEAGFPVSSVAAIRDQYDSLPSGLAALLLEWIPRLEDRRLQESVAWALLAARSGTLDGAALAELFDTVADAAGVRQQETGCADAGSVGHDDDLKRAIASVINQTRPRNIDEWLIAVVRDRRSGASRNLLAAAVAKMLPPERAVPVLLKVFHEAPLAAVHPLGKVGDSSVREFLAAQQPSATGSLRRELRQAIARIDRRLEKRRRAGRDTAQGKH